MIWGALQAPGCNVQLWLRITDLPKLLQFAKEETEVQGDEMLTDSRLCGQLGTGWR